MQVVDGIPIGANYEALRSVICAAFKGDRYYPFPASPQHNCAVTMEVFSIQTRDCICEIPMV